MLFLVLLVIGLRPGLTTGFIQRMRRKEPIDLSTRIARSNFAGRLDSSESTLLLLAKAYLVVYGALRLATYPWLGLRIGVLGKPGAGTR